MLNDFFLSVSSLDDSNVNLPPNMRILPNESNLSELNLTEQDILDQMKLIDTSKAYGLDSLPPMLIKEGGHSMCNLLLRLFTISLQTSRFPSIWKSANVTPLHKKDDTDIVSNYRPISILSTVSKIFEKIVFKYIYNHFKDNFVLSDFQSGFLPGRSTITQLIEVYHMFCASIDNGKEVRVIFLDISKAFDQVWHKGILHKLENAGITGQLHRRFQDYLTECQQR